MFPHASWYIFLRFLAMGCPNIATFLLAFTLLTTTTRVQLDSAYCTSRFSDRPTNHAVCDSGSLRTCRYSHSHTQCNRPIALHTTPSPFFPAPSFSVVDGPTSTGSSHSGLREFSRSRTTYSKEQLLSLRSASSPATTSTAASDDSVVGSSLCQLLYGMGLHSRQIPCYHPPFRRAHRGRRPHKNSPICRCILLSLLLLLCEIAC